MNTMSCNNYTIKMYAWNSYKMINTWDFESIYKRGKYLRSVLKKALYEGIQSLGFNQWCKIWGSYLR